MKHCLVSSALLWLVMASACTMSARLYDLQSANLLTAHYKASGSGQGPIWIGETQQTATCQGEYVTVPHGSSGWGMIFTGGTTATAIASVTDSDQQGRAIVNCHDGQVIECEYITSAMTGKGHGACQDNQLRHYRLMF